MATQLMSADDVGRTIARIAHQIIEKTALDAEKESAHPEVCLMGIPSGGVPLAQRLAARIAASADSPIDPASLVGQLDITLYRDDLRHSTTRTPEPTKLPDTRAAIELDARGCADAARTQLSLASLIPDNQGGGRHRTSRMSGSREPPCGFPLHCRR